MDYEYKRFASAIQTADNMRPAKGRAPGDVRVSRAIRSSPLLRVRAADSHLVPQHLNEQFVAIGIPRFHDDASLARTRSCRLAVRPRHSRTAGNVLQPVDCKDISRMGGRSADRVTFLLQKPNHSHLQFASVSTDLAEPCTSACAIASPTDNSSKQPPNSRPSRGLKALVRPRSRSLIGSVRALDAVRAGNSHWISSIASRHGRVRSCCPITYRHRLDSPAPGSVDCHSNTLPPGTMTPLRTGASEAVASPGNQALFGTASTI